MKEAKPAGVHKNALSHGLYAQDLVLPWENEQDFVDLHKALRNELEPDGPAEEEAVLGIAGLYWKKRRLTIGAQLSYQALPDVPALSKAGESGWRGVGEYLQSTSDKMGIVREELRRTGLIHAAVLQDTFLAVKAKIAKLDSPAPSASEKVDPYAQSRKESLLGRQTEQLDALNDIVEGLKEIGVKVLTPMQGLFDSENLVQIEADRIFRPDIIEREVRIGALIDRQIEKGLSQLVHLKEYKRMYKKKQVTGPLGDVIAPTSKSRTEKEAE
jgi:hypothetical protein